MVRIIVTLSFIFNFVACWSQGITTEFLQGEWTLEKISRVDGNYLAEEYPPPLPDDNIWVFHGDTATRYNYPFNLIEQCSFEIDSGRLNYSGWKFGFAYVYADSGRLVASMDHGAVLTFKRDTLSSDTNNCLGILLKDTINPGAMIANYYMVTQFVPDDEAAYDFKPPVSMPIKFSIRDSTVARQIIHSRTVYITAGGKRRPFHLTSVEWDASYYAHRSEFTAVDVPVITIYPYDWWTGEPFQVVYRGSEKEIASKKAK